jgi:hypothetical protein
VIKSDYKKVSFHAELEHMFGQFSKYHMNIFLGDFSERVGRKNTLKLTVGNERLHEVSNGNVAASENLIVNSILFARHIIHKYILTSPDGIKYNQMYHILIDRNTFYMCRRWLWK